MVASPAYAEHPDHTIDVSPHEGRVTVRFADRVVAETDRALELRETSHDPVLYVPREDCSAELMEPSDRPTHCPFKGDARYWTLRAGDAVARDAAWAYDEPFDQVAAIARHVAFYLDRVSIEA